jgi:DNA invertase Pin-like site-specific DNA recombinase
MLLGYTRISKADGSQNLDLQHDALVANGVDEDQIYKDKMSGRHDVRPGLEACLKSLREGDTLVVWKLDRLGRNLRHLIELIEKLSAKNIGLKVLTGQGAAIDTTRPEGKLVFGIFAALAEFERELIVERTRAGLAAARARGRKGGRPRKMTPSKIRMAMAAMSDPKAKAHLVAEELGITTTTLYDYVNGDGGPKKAAQDVLNTSTEDA